MNTVATSAPAEQMKLHTATPSFFGMVRGEFFKISRLRLVWFLFLLLAGVIILPYLVIYTVPQVKDTLTHQPLVFLSSRVTQNLEVLRAFIGIFLMILTAYVIGQEYQLGTIRVLLSRGVGRLQLLAAKLVALVGYALVLLIGCLVFNAILLCVLISVLVGNLNALNAIDATLWSNAGTVLLTVMISMGVTILMATAVSVLGRSLTIGLSVSLAWFAVDNVGEIILMLAYRITHNDFWLNVTAYLLGPNLNALSQVWLPKFGLGLGFTPYVNIDLNHTLLVILGYALVFAAVATVLTWRRDVQE